MNNNFDQVFDRIIGLEGGYVNNPNDPGGETKYGISKRAYPHYNISELTREQAKEIYRVDFWDKLQLENVYPSVTYQLFDFAVNSGINTAIRYFQRALGVADDGYFGPISKAAAQHMSECDMILSLNAERLEFMTKLSSWDLFGQGWARRISMNLKYASRDLI